MRTVCKSFHNTISCRFLLSLCETNCVAVRGIEGGVYGRAELKVVQSELIE